MKLWLGILVFLCLGASVPLVPTLPKRPHKSAAIHQGRAALDLIAKAPRAALAPSIRLDWDFAGSQEAIVFNVRCLKGPLSAPDPSWPIVATMTSNACNLPLDKGASMVWFGVTASNTITGLESVWTQ